MDHTMLESYLTQANAVGFKTYEDMSQPLSEVVSAINHATNYINSSEFNIAAAIVRKAEGKLTRNQERLFFAECYIANGDYEAALRLINILISTDKNNCHYLNLAAGAYLCLNDYKKATAILKQILKINKNFKAAVLNSASISQSDTKQEPAPDERHDIAPVAIFTSINPKNFEPSIYAMKTWSDHGFKVYSCNYDHEIDILKDVFPNVEFLPIPQPDIFLYGKQTIRLIDIFKCMEAVSYPIVALVNSDISISANKNIFSYLTEHASKGLVFSSRVDVIREGDGEGRFYDDGLDFFCFHKDFLKKMPENLFALGHPWWDYFMPLAFFHAELPLFHLHTPITFHVAHETNWDRNSWCCYGYHLSQLFLPDYANSIFKYMKNSKPPKEVLQSLAGYFIYFPRMLDMMATPLYSKDIIDQKATSPVDLFRTRYPLNSTKVLLSSKQP